MHIAYCINSTDFSTAKKKGRRRKEEKERKQKKKKKKEKKRKKKGANTYLNVRKEILHRRRPMVGSPTTPASLALSSPHDSCKQGGHSI